MRIHLRGGAEGDKALEVREAAGLRQWRGGPDARARIKLMKARYWCTLEIRAIHMPVNGARHIHQPCQALKSIAIWSRHEVEA
jgi:hypothetical protein